MSDSNKKQASYKMWVITKNYQSTPIDENIRMALGYYAKKGFNILAIEVSRSNECSDAIDGVQVKQSGDVLKNHILFEIESKQKEDKENESN